MHTNSWGLWAAGRLAHPAHRSEKLGVTINHRVLEFRVSLGLGYEVSALAWQNLALQDQWSSWSEEAHKLIRRFRA